MNDCEHTSENSLRETVADQNVRRLVSSAYRPEVPCPEFVQRATATMLAESAARLPSSSWHGRYAIRRVAGWALATSLLLLLGVLLGSLMSRRYLPRNGERERLVHEAGIPATANPRKESRAASRLRDLPIEEALTARPRTAVQPTQKLSAGETLTTGPDQRRRVELPDGSIVYLNHDAQITLQSDRHVVLARGEIFVEVAPRYADGASEEGDSRGDRRFVVVTPDRELIALGTKFNVRTDAQRTSVAVVQGKVQVSGLVEPLNAGQRLAPSADASPNQDVVPIEQVAHVIDWTRDLVASAESPLVPASNYRGGALIAKRPDGQETGLSMRRYHIDVHIEDGFARTTIDQTYFNHESWRMEGTFYFPLPPDASLSRLAMYVNGQLMEGGMAEREHARNVFETIVRRQKDPALLEWIDGSTFRMRVFPLEGRQEKRIVLSYTQRLPRLGDRIQYRFPGGHNMPNVRNWSCHVRAKGAAGCRWQADSYEFKASEKGRNLIL
ncbi:MAG: FecR domain-containing protein, partial [Planctomycetes bacterium]|nr:FecR domain-containing protein [Planctomycetota bacterium]